MIACALVLFGPVNPAADGATPGFQPRIVPSSVANRKIAGSVVEAPERFTPVIWKAPWPAAILKTSPVGVPSFPMGSAGAGPGIKTTSCCGVPAVLCSVAAPAPLSDTQKGEPVDSPTPQGFRRIASVLTAVWTTPLASISGFLLATRSVSTKPAAKATPVAHANAAISERAVPCQRTFRFSRLAAAGTQNGEGVIMRGSFRAIFTKHLRPRPAFGHTPPSYGSATKHSPPDKNLRAYLPAVTGASRKLFHYPAARCVRVRLRWPPGGPPAAGDQRRPRHAGVGPMRRRPLHGERTVALRAMLLRVLVARRPHPQRPQIRQRAGAVQDQRCQLLRTLFGDARARARDAHRAERRAFIPRTNRRGHGRDAELGFAQRHAITPTRRCLDLAQ